MRLNELLSCVTTDQVRYKNYKRRGQLPFLKRDEFSIPPGEKTHSRWANFSLEDALRLQVMVDLSEYSWPDTDASSKEFEPYDGLPPMSAASIASNGIGETIAKYGSLAGIWTADEDIWHVAMIKAEFHKGNLWYGMDRFSGTLSECAAKIEERKKDQVRAILFNVSQAFERVLSAGEANAVTEAVDFIDAENA